MPRMTQFILKNQPMAQLIENNNIQLMEMRNDNVILFDNFVIGNEAPSRARRKVKKLKKTQTKRED